MRTIMIVNPKGGSGKSTLATNLASFYACWGIRVTLIDFDPQGSSLAWLEARPEGRPAIFGQAAKDGEFTIPQESDYVIMDLPSGLYGEALTAYLRRADTLLVPVLPSPIDIRATGQFFRELFEDEAIRAKRIPAAIIANRVKENTRIFHTLEANLEAVALPYVAKLREAQSYIHAADQGLGVFELPKRLALRDMAQWQPLIRWLSTSEPLSAVTPNSPEE